MIRFCIFVLEWCVFAIACTLRWGVALVGEFSTMHYLPCRGKIFLGTGDVGHGALKTCNLYCFMKTILYI